MKPILFNTQMVQAILDGRKTQTRRIVKPQPQSYSFDGRFYIFDEGELPKPQYQPGDILWVRETWQRTKAGRYIYRADKEIRGGSAYYNEHCRLDDGWRPSIHMPKESARIFLRVTDVRVERLQDINTEDIKAEGITVPHGFPPVTPYSRFADLWDSTIKLAEIDRFGWNANPWVWVIRFERYEPSDTEGGANDG